MNPRALKRIVTGVDGGGNSVVIERGAPPVVLDSGSGWIAEQWVGTAERETLEIGASRWQVSPPAGGFAFRLVEFAAAGQPGSRSAMHATPSLDCLVVLSGRIWLRLPDEEHELGPGDSVVQRETTHRWENRADEPCVVAVFLLSTEPA